MTTFRCSIALAALAAQSLAPAVTSAQEPSTRSWQLALWTQAGYQYPMGRFAKNSPYEIPELGLLDAIAEFGRSQTLGGGVELVLPEEGFALRVGWETTKGAEATGTIAICSVLDGNLCRDEVAPTRMRSVMFEARSSYAGPDRRFAPVLVLGAGLRWYGFSVPDCTGRPSTEKLVCDAITDLYRESKPNLIMRLGGGVRGHLDRLLTEFTVSAGTGRYTGGAGTSEGLWYHDLRANLSVGVALF